MTIGRNDFHHVLAAEVVSNFGSMLSRIAIPWFATLALAATPLQMGWLLVADVGAGAAGSLLLGALIDRTGKRLVMLAADVLRASVLGLLTWLAWSGILAMWMLVISAAGISLLTIAFELARSAWMAQRLEARWLATRNAQLSVGSSLSEAAAFALGGWLYQGLGAVVSLTVDGLSYLVSAMCLRGVKESPAPLPNITDSDSAQRMRVEVERTWRVFQDGMRIGVAAITASPTLRVLGGIEILVALGTSVAGTSYMIFVSRDIAFSTGSLGLIFATGGLGSVAGATLAIWLGRRVGSRGAIATGLALFALGALCIPLAGGATFVGAALLVAHQIIGDGGYTVAEVHNRTLRQTAVPAALLARVDGGLRALGQSATLVGALGGGILANLLGARAALIVSAIFLAAAALLARSRLTKRS